MNWLNVQDSKLESRMELNHLLSLLFQVQDFIAFIQVHYAKTFGWIHYQTWKNKDDLHWQCLASEGQRGLQYFDCYAKYLPYSTC